MAKKAPESKSAQSAKISKSNAGDKKKWTTGKQKSEVSRLASVDEALGQKIAKDVANMRVITRTTIAEKYNLNLHSSIRILRFLAEEKIIKDISSGSRLKIYCGAQYAKTEIIEEVSVSVEKDEEGLEAWA